MVMTMPDIVRGDPVHIELQKGNVRVSVAAIARENGYRGRKMWVENASNHKLVRVVVKDRNTVTIL
jgi:flagella basal body P-ring formation protein FlgA